MMVPCSYHHRARQRQSSPEHCNEKSAGWSSIERTRPAPVLKGEQDRPTPAARTVTEPASVPSKPVVIPSRRPSVESIASQPRKTRGQSRDRHPRPMPDVHRPDAIPPAIAALLAVTAIPPPRANSSQRRRSSLAARQLSVDDLVEEWRREYTSGYSVGASSRLDILLERPGESGSHDISIICSGSEKEQSTFTPRSASSESIPSLPSLEPDERSLPPWSTASTPASLSRKPGAERREKQVASPTKQECVDHPLLSPLPHDSEPTPDSYFRIAPKQPPSPKPKSTFKSNLTASLQALKSAAKSFSNFTAPSIPPDDLLTRSVFSSRYPSEMRPKPHEGVPTPALRRYLNPTTKHLLSPTDFSTQLQGDAGRDGNMETEKKAPMIQLQTYSRSPRAPRSRSPPTNANTSKQRRAGVPSATTASPSPDPLTEAGRAALIANNPAVRQREPRENSDFLRVVVLEMNMRRRGKLDAKAAGRARVWLPPRRMAGAGGAVEGGRGRGRVPGRWVGVCVNELG